MSGREREYVCPECERKAIISSNIDSLVVLLGCSDGHETLDMVEWERYYDTGNDQ